MISKYTYIIITICIILIYFFINNKKKSNKLNEIHNINITYLTPKNANNNIKKFYDVYISFMNKPNLIARNCNSLDILKNNYKIYFDNITNDNINNIDIKLSNILDKIKILDIKYYNYIKYWLNNICFAKSKSNLESNMPHTCGNIIIMNNIWFNNPTPNILLHEITHIHQRFYPNDFINMYTELGYIYFDIKNIKNLHNILELNRNNPDGLDINWLWKSKQNNLWWIGAIFTSDKPKDLHSVNHIAIKININKNNYICSNNIILLDNLTEFTDYFNNYNDNYHPNEMCAMYAEWYITEILYNKKYNSNAYNTYKKHLHEIIYNYSEIS